jgi:hypothetical protein
VAADVPRRERARRATPESVMARIEKRSKSCIATVVAWPDPGPPGCPPDSVMLLLMGCGEACPVCDDARRRIWRVPPPTPALTDAPTFPPDDL